MSFREAEAAAEGFERILDRLLVYDIFPPDVVRYMVCPGGRISDGSTIVQRIGRGVAIEAGVRVVDVWDRQQVDGRRAGFAYVTLTGHPERGVASFEVQRTGEIVAVELTARSRPGTVMSRLARGLARRIQVALTERAVVRLTTI